MSASLTASLLASVAAGDPQSLRELHTKAVAAQRLVSDLIASAISRGDHDQRWSQLDELMLDVRLMTNCVASKAEAEARR